MWRGGGGGGGRGLFKFHTVTYEMKLHINADACEKFGDHENVIRVTKFRLQH